MASKDNHAFILSVHFEQVFKMNTQVPFLSRLTHLVFSKKIFFLSTQNPGITAVLL